MIIYNGKQTTVKEAAKEIVNRRLNNFSECMNPYSYLRCSETTETNQVCAAVKELAKELAKKI